MDELSVTDKIRRSIVFGSIGIVGLYWATWCGDFWDWTIFFIVISLISLITWSFLRLIEIDG